MAASKISIFDIPQTFDIDAFGHSYNHKSVRCLYFFGVIASYAWCSTLKLSCYHCLCSWLSVFYCYRANLFCILIYRLAGKIKL